VRYTPEQVEALERVYGECPKPSSLRRQQLIRECPILSNIEPKQIKVWFQNRRCVRRRNTPEPLSPSIIILVAVYASAYLLTNYALLLLKFVFLTPSFFFSFAVFGWVKLLLME
jgi:hypothetical protein